jgi:hypothetical protein
MFTAASHLLSCEGEPRHAGCTYRICLQVLMSILANIMRSVIIVNTDVAAEGEGRCL